MGRSRSFATPSCPLTLMASSKDVVRHLCQECFPPSATNSVRLVDSTVKSLSVTPEEAKQLICSLHGFTRQIVFQGLTSAEEILPLFPDDFHQNLKNLLTKIILENISQVLSKGHEDSKRQLFSSPPMLPDLLSFSRAAWRSETLANQISLPHLIDMDWRVDIKTSSDNINRMAVPTCLLQMKIQDDINACRGGPIISTVSLELSKEKLDTMLDGLSRIRDQLSAVANK
ncbi:COMM domain-containing protein 9 isoform X2 [Carcharodon carcharias]|uniref:COMM domain-containing protein 9 isoform X2 n=1 Tax=Carcharodon carcharias TaxID=13397 RepID=UPI001B7EDEA1|nr:COMM domain-containing protein 9 isoform X2 [Carcharodon carcharias]